MTTTIETKLCSVDGCEESARYQWPDLCLPHFRSQRLRGRTRSETQIEVQCRREQVAELTRQGCSTSVVAERLGMTERMVQRDRRALGLSQHRPNPHYTEQEIATIESMLDDGCSYAEVARAVGRDMCWISKRWPGRGWTPQQAAEYLACLRKLDTLA